jgi:hypothetical protein
VRAAIGAKVTDVVVRGARSGGLVSELGTYGLQVDGLSSSGNFFDGLAACKTYDSVYKRLHLFHNQSAGISTDLDFRGNEIHGAVISENRDVGIFMRYSSENLYENVRVVNSFSHGIFMAAAWGEPDCAKDNEFRNLTVVNSGGYGILLHDPCQGNRLTGNPDFQGNQLGCLGLVEGATFGLPLGFQCSVQSWLKRNAPSFL